MLSRAQVVTENTGCIGYITMEADEGTMTQATTLRRSYSWLLLLVPLLFSFLRGSPEQPDFATLLLPKVSSDRVLIGVSFLILVIVVVIAWMAE